jgi:hypothetical protein
VKLDMAAREAMTAHIPYSAYFPEPFLVARFSRRLSFLGAGRALESRRLIENGKLSGALNDEATFIKSGIVTTSPERWKTKKNRSYPTLTPANLRQKAVLEALRGLSQSHIHPKKWADQVYVGLDFSCSQVTDATTPMMRIFSVFDPISRMLGSEGRFTSLVFDRVLRDYEKPLSSVQEDILMSSKGRLLALRMPIATIQKVIATAKATGRAIYREILVVSSSL